MSAAPPPLIPEGPLTLSTPSPPSASTPVVNVALFVVAVIIGLAILFVTTLFLHQCLRDRRERKKAAVAYASRYGPSFGLRGLPREPAPPSSTSGSRNALSHTLPSRSRPKNAFNELVDTDAADSFRQQARTRRRSATLKRVFLNPSTAGNKIDDYDEVDENTFNGVRFNSADSRDGGQHIGFHLPLPSKPNRTFQDSDRHKSYFKTWNGPTGGVTGRGGAARESVWFEHIDTGNNTADHDHSRTRTSAGSAFLLGSADPSLTLDTPVHVAQRVPAQALYEHPSSHSLHDVAVTGYDHGGVVGIPQRMTRAYHFSLEGALPPSYSSGPSQTPAPSTNNVYTTNSTLNTTAAPSTPSSKQPALSRLPSALTPGAREKSEKDGYRMSALSFANPASPSSRGARTKHLPTVIVNGSAPTEKSLPLVPPSKSASVSSPNSTNPFANPTASKAASALPPAARPRSYWLNPDDWLTDYPYAIPSLRGVSADADTAIDMGGDADADDEDWSPNVDYEPAAVNL